MDVAGEKFVPFDAARAIYAESSIVKSPRRRYRYVQQAHLSQPYVEKAFTDGDFTTSGSPQRTLREEKKEGEKEGSGTVRRKRVTLLERKTGDGALLTSATVM